MDEDYFKIDENDLIEECKMQPILYLQESKKAADAKLLYDEACSAIDVVVAELERDIRKNPEKYSMVKGTESEIKNAVLLQPKYQEAMEDRQKTQHRMMLQNGVLTALEHRKRSLTLIVELRANNFFSEVRPSQRAVEKENERNDKRTVRTLGQRKREDNDE